ncbi:hypothetical protein FACS189499_05540 [Clostridia bacterium]|nr:hypothetical protein FACS189499_05540 [Clostridia bacterium]
MFENNNKFTVEEINLMCIFAEPSGTKMSGREKLIAEILEFTDDFDTGDPQSDSEMIDIARNILDKIDKMSDKDFAELNVYPIYEYEESEENL